MPWFPDFVAAVELARRETRAAGEVDPIRQYLTAIEHGDARALETVWPGNDAVKVKFVQTLRQTQAKSAFAPDLQALASDYK